MNILKNSLSTILCSIAMTQTFYVQAMHNTTMYEQLAALHQTFKQAESEREIVPFDEPTHGIQARHIFYRAFGFQPSYLKSNTIGNEVAVHKRTVDVLLFNKNVIGVIAYYDKEDPEMLFKIRHLDRLVIDDNYRRQVPSNGELLLNDFEEKTRKANISMIELVSYKQSLNFYKRMHYEQTSGILEMQKILN